MARKTNKEKRERKKRQSERKRWQSLKKRIGLVTLLSLCVCVLSFALFLFLRRSPTTQFGGYLTQFGDVELQYNTHQGEGISPLCGCLAEKSADEWRGITFAARSVKISRTGEQPDTGYYLSCPLPERTSWLPLNKMFKLKATLYSLNVPDGEMFDPEVLIGEGASSTYENVEMKELPASTFIMLVTGKPMNIALLGNTPLGAWVPVKGSKVAVKYSKGLFPSSVAVASVEETYNAYNQSAIHTDEEKRTYKLDDVVEYPLGDFLGPDLVFWTYDQSAFIVSPQGAFFTDVGGKQGGRRVTAVLFRDSNFSVRVACQPFESEEVRNYVSQKQGEKINYYLSRNVRDSGKMLIEISDPEGQTANFQDAYAYMKENPVVWVRVPCACHFKEGNQRDENNITNDEWNFRYPPVPPNSGFNIFGPINYLKMSSARGNLMLGTQALDITAPSPLEFRNIRSLQVDGGVIAVPIQLDAAKDTAEVKLQAVSEVYLNGGLVKMKDVGKEEAAEYISLLCALCSIITALITIGSIIIKRPS